MIQKESRLEVADNSGAKLAMVIGVLGCSTASGKFTRPTMGIGDRIVVSIKKALPNGEVKAGDKAQAIIVRCKSPTRREDGSYVRFDSNACVLVDEGNPHFRCRCTRIAREELYEDCVARNGGHLICRITLKRAMLSS